VPVPSTFQLTVIIGIALLVITLILYLATRPASKGMVLNILFQKDRALSYDEIANELNPFRTKEKHIREHLASLISDGDAKRIGNAYRITEDANARLRKEVTDMPPITLDNMP